MGYILYSICHTLWLLYAAIVSLLFYVWFICLFPWFVLAINVPACKGWARRLGYLLAKGAFVVGCLPTRVRYDEPLSKQNTYIFCANHTSFLDIPAVALCKHRIAFVGKDSIAKVPLWGYMYKNLHLTVHRSSFRSRSNVLKRIISTLTQGTSIGMFPEGGIRSKYPPKLANFQDGAFVAAVKTKVPIVPTVLYYNWLIFPKYIPKYLNLHPRPHIAEIHYLKPIQTNQKTEKDVQKLKEIVKNQIQNALEKRFPRIMS